MPHPISQTWELTISIPHWILAFFHIEGGLLITFEVTVSAHQTLESYTVYRHKFAQQTVISTLLQKLYS